MIDLEQEMEAILSAARDAHQPGPHDAARVRRNLTVALSGLAVTTSLSASAAASAVVNGVMAGAGPTGVAAGVSGTSVLGVLKSGAVGLLVGTVAIGGGSALYTTVVGGPGVTSASRPEPAMAEGAPHPKHASHEAARVAVEVAAGVTAEPPRAPAPAGFAAFPPAVGAPPNASRAAGNPPPSKATTAELAREALALQNAQQDLERDPVGALRQLDEMANQHPNGALTEDALAARVFAYCNAGQRASATRAAARFFATYPASVHAPRIRASCAVTPVTSAETDPPANGQ